VERERIIHAKMYFSGTPLDSTKALSKLLQYYNSAGRAGYDD
jgi:hypothetical protein